MRLRFSSPVIGLAVALGSAAAGCGSEEMFTPELGTNERLIDTAAFARIARSDEGLQDVVVVGDLDGDGIDDAVIRTAFSLENAHGFGTGGAVYVVYGGRGVRGQIDMATLPTLVKIGSPDADVVPLGDVDGDGLADFAVGIAFTPGCGVPPLPEAMVIGDNLQNSGAYIVYGSHTRLTGSHPIGDVGAFVRDPVACTASGGVARLGDIDGDGKADFAIVRNPVPNSPPVESLFVFYGRSARLSGTVDLTTTADAEIADVALPQFPTNVKVGDVDGDGLDDFVVGTQRPPGDVSMSLVRGSATRLSGTLALGDLGATAFRVGSCSLAFPEIDALGDLDGDGVDDFALTSCGEVQGTDTVTGAKEYHLFYGRKGGLPSQLGPGDQDATIPVTSSLFDSQLIAGDASGDGIPDLILADSAFHDMNGGVHVLKGRAGVRLSGLVDPVARSFVTYVGETQRDSGPCASGTVQERLGSQGIAIGDVNGDHHPDLLITALNSFPVKGGTCDTTLARLYVASPPAGTNP